METLAKELVEQINIICVEYHYFKRTDVIEKTKKIHGNIQEYLSFFLQGNVFGIDEAEYHSLCQYVLQVLRDYSEAFTNGDMVLMIDVLDYGVRTLLKLVVDTDDGEDSNE